MSLHAHPQPRPHRRDRLSETTLFETTGSVTTLFLAVLGAIALPILVGALLLAVGALLPTFVRLGLVFVAVAVGAFLTSVLVDAPVADTFGRWYEGR